MTTVAEDLVKVRDKLNDPLVAQDDDEEDGTLWSNAELLRWYRDGYRTLLAQSQAVRRFIPFDTPGRVTYAITQEWEDRHASRGTVRKLHRTGLAGTRQTTGLWEVQTLDGITPTVQFGGFTQEWERAYVDVTDRHFRFTFPRNHERVVRLEWQHKRLAPVATRHLDDSDTNWMQQVGLPRWWTTGTGRIKAVDVYEIDTEIHQGYALYDYERGLPRRIVGELEYDFQGEVVANTWGFTSPFEAAFVTPHAVQFTLPTSDPEIFVVNEWEVEHLLGITPTTVGYVVSTHSWHIVGASLNAIFREGALGTIRRILGGSRQYLALYSDANPASLCGRVADWRSSQDSMMALEVVLPDVDVQTSDVPALLPYAMQKYLRYYVLSMAFGRVGEGRNVILGEHYLRRFSRGVAFFQRLGDVAHKDRVWVRDEYTQTIGRPPRVRLPATFERQW